MSILSELKKLTGKNSATVISDALPDSAGGSKQFVIMVTGIDNERESSECDKTWDEILEAVERGDDIKIRWHYSQDIGGPTYDLLTQIVRSGHGTLTSVIGTFIYIDDPSDIDSGYEVISVIINDHLCEVVYKSQ